MIVFKISHKAYIPLKWSLISSSATAIELSTRSHIEPWLLEAIVGEREREKERERERERREREREGGREGGREGECECVSHLLLSPWR